jgi:hypothetical protein
MKNYFLLTIILFTVLGCKNRQIDKPEKSVQKSDSLIEKKIIIKKPKKENLEDWKHSEFLEFEDYKEYRISDTINVDLNGNGILESVYFENNDCPKILIKEDGKELISIGCGSEGFYGFPKAIDWVDLWCVVSDKIVWEVLFTENGDIDKDTIANLERPSIYIGKEEAGGGIITYRNGKPYWIQQSD